MNIPVRIVIFDAAGQGIQIIRVLFTKDISVEGILYSQGNQRRTINNLATILNPSPARAGLVRFAIAGQYDRLTIAGADGRAVAELELAGQGVRAAAWNCRGVPAGTYVARATGRSGAVSRQFIVLR